PCHCDTLLKIANSQPKFHTMKACKCNQWNCQFCQGGLFACDVCGLCEGELTSECSGSHVSQDASAKCYNGTLNYICGEWVTGCFTLYEGQKAFENRSIAFWAGRIYCLVT